MRKVKNCYGCPADNGRCGCLLKYERVGKYEIFNKVSLLIYSPVKCCHKPKSVKEFFKRLKSSKENEE